MATGEPVELPTEVLERIDAFLKDSGGGTRRDRPQRHEEPEVETETDVEVDDEEIDPIVVMLRKEREMRGWTQRELGQRLGYSAARISQLENGEHDVQLSTLRFWASALDVEIQARVIKRRGRPRTNFK